MEWRQELMLEINETISHLRIQEDVALIQMWEGEIIWLQSGEFEDLFTQHIKTIWGM